jgi:coiled-coil and C2 domain-containing protein 2A
MYEGIRGDEIANLPLRFKEPNSVNWGNRGTDFSRERDFQQLLPNLNIVDIHDPRSDSLIYLKSKAPVHKDIDVFQLLGLNFSVPFGEEGDTYLNFIKFQDNLRMKLLKLRETKPFLFTEPIPLSEQSIKSSELYKKIIAKELFIETEDKYLDVSSQKLKISDFMSRVRNSVSSLNRGTNRKLNTGSVVATTEYFQLVESLPWTALIPPRKRELRPAPKARLPIAMQVNNCNLLVQLVGARNVPLRKQDDRASDNSRRNLQKDRINVGGYNNDPSISGDLLDESKIGEKKRARSYLSLKFQENSVRTVCVDGGAPLWKESVSLPFRAPQDDFTPSNLLQVQDDIAVMLFDEVVEDDSEIGGKLFLILFLNQKKNYSYLILFILYRPS